MKKLLNGCLIVFSTFLLLIVLFALGVYIYSKIPNHIVIEPKPISFTKIKDEIEFPIGNIPECIKFANEDKIVYQAFVTKYDWTQESTYICVLRIKDNSIKFRNKLPIKKKQYSALNDMLQFRSITNKYFPTIELPKKMKTQPGTKVRIFNPSFEEKLNFNSGTYQYEKSKDIDKVGNYTEVIIYDQTNNILYYERMRFHAFQ